MIYWYVNSSILNHFCCFPSYSRTCIFRSSQGGLMQTICCYLCTVTLHISWAPDQIVRSVLFNYYLYFFYTMWRTGNWILYSGVPVPLVCLLISSRVLSMMTHSHLHPPMFSYIITSFKGLTSCPASLSIREAHF